MILWGLASVAYGGQIGLEPITLEEVIARSSAIVVATLLDPPTSTGERWVDEGCAPWAAARYHVTVERVLKTTPDGPAPEDRLAVWAGYTSQMVELERRACKEGSRKSPIQQTYANGRYEWVAGESVVLFLTEEGDTWELAVHGAFEPAKKLKKVEKLLAPPSAG